MVEEAIEASHAIYGMCCGLVHGLLDEHFCCTSRVRSLAVMIETGVLLSKVSVKADTTQNILACYWLAQFVHAEECWLGSCPCRVVLNTASVQQGHCVQRYGNSAPARDDKQII